MTIIPVKRAGRDSVVVLPVAVSFRRRERGRNNRTVQIADPAKGILSFKAEEFRQHWTVSRKTNMEESGTALLLEPSPKFYEEPGEKEQTISWTRVLQYLRPSRWALTQVFIALVITSLLQLIFPFLTQSIVDTGVNTRNLQFITIPPMLILLLPRHFLRWIMVTWPSCPTAWRIRRRRRLR